MTLYTSVIIHALLAVVGSLAWGVASMAHAGFQVLAFVLLILALLFPFS